MAHPTRSGADPAPSGAMLEDRHLVDEARSGDREAFRLLVERHMREIYNVAFRFVRNHHDADEIAQETFVRAFESLPSFRGESEFRSWVYRIAMNLSLNSLKAARRRRDREGADLETLSLPGEDGMDILHRKELAVHIERALHELPTMQRATVILRHIQGLSTRQVSEILHCTEGTVKTHLFRGLEKMRKQLKFLEHQLS